MNIIIIAGVVKTASNKSNDDLTAVLLTLITPQCTVRAIRLTEFMLQDKFRTDIKPVKSFNILKCEEKKCLG